jgi:hypothetical protein
MKQSRALPAGWPLRGRLRPAIAIDDLEVLLKDPALMEAYAVNHAVNSVKNDTEECIQPMSD